MLLQKVGLFNDLSEALRSELEEKIRGYGKQVRYKFDISNKNPDPSNHDGKILWPNCYTLDPAVFNINDKQEVKGKQSSKRVGLVDGTNERGEPNKFKKIKIYGRDRGVLRLNVEEDPEHFDMAMYIEIHPKLTGGKFADTTKRQIISRIDEQAAATKAREDRKARTKAMSTAELMSDKEIIDFADAMTWDSSQDILILRNEAEMLADTDPIFFNDLVGGKSIEYRAAVKQALNKQLIMFDPAENKFSWASNRQVIAVLSATEKSEVEALADWLQGAGSKETEIYKKIKSLISGKQVPA
jgi:hypothetical protein